MGIGVTTVMSGPYDTDGLDDTFPFVFRLMASDEIEVLLVNDTTGALSVVAPADYTVSGGTTDAGGNVVFDAAPADGSKVYIRRLTTRLQESPYPANSAYSPLTLRADLDRLTAIAQEVQENVNRAITWPRNESISGVLPVPGSRAGRVLGFGSAGTLTTYDQTEGVEDPDLSLQAIRARRAHGVLLMRDALPSTDTSPVFALYDVDGERQSLASSTTDGLAEALALVAASADNLKVNGAGRVNPSGTSKGSLVLTTALQMPALDCVNVELETAIVSTDHATIGAGDPGFQIDSFVLATLKLAAQFTGDHAGPVVEINPETNGGGDANKQIGVADIFLLGAINTITSAGSKAILVNASTGTNISRSNFRIMESNGGEIGVDIRTTGTGTIHGDHFDLFGAHDYGVTGYAIGVTGGTQILGCTFNIRNYGATSGTYGLRVGTTQCSFLYNNDGATQTTDVSIESGAVKNDIYLLRLNGTTPVADASDKSNAIHLPGRWVVQVDRNGTNQTSIADNTFTKVQYTTKRYDTYSAFDASTNYRATIAIPGWYDIEVNAGWSTGEDGLELFNAIYVNGSQVRGNSVQVGGAAGNIGAPQLRCMLYLAKDDYVEHFVLHNGTGTRDLLGAAARTSMTIRRLD